MKKAILGTALALLISPAYAGPAIYQNGVLTLDEAIVIKPNGDSYYRDLRFETDASGTLRFDEAVQSQLAVVEEIEVVSEATEPSSVTATISGYKSLPCVALEPLGITRDGNAFHVVVAETPIPPNVKCTAVTAPFTVEI